MLSILDHAEPLHNEMKARKARKVERAIILPVRSARRLHRRHKTIIHLSLVALVALSLATGYDHHADWLFVALGVIVELS